MAGQVFFSRSIHRREICFEAATGVYNRIKAFKHSLYLLNPTQFLQTKSLEYHWLKPATFNIRMTHHLNKISLLLDNNYSINSWYHIPCWAFCLMHIKRIDPGVWNKNHTLIICVPGSRIIYWSKQVQQISIKKYYQNSWHLVSFKDHLNLSLTKYSDTM